MWKCRLLRAFGTGYRFKSDACILFKCLCFYIKIFSWPNYQNIDCWKHSKTARWTKHWTLNRFVFHWRFRLSSLYPGRDAMFSVCLEHKKTPTVVYYGSVFVVMVSMMCKVFHMASAQTSMRCIFYLLCTPRAQENDWLLALQAWGKALIRLTFTQSFRKVIKRLSKSVHVCSHIK